MKLKEFIQKLDDPKILFINGNQYDDSLSEDILDKEIKKIIIEIEEKNKQDLESLGYSFEVGV